MTGEAVSYGASIVWLGAKIFTSITEIIGSNLYVIRQTKRLKGIYAHPHSRKLRGRPLVSVVVYAHNAEATIGGCLESLRCGRYRKLEIIVAEYGSRDGTRRVIRDYIAAHPKLTIRLVAKRVRPVSWQAMSPARHVHGELIVYLNGRQAASPSMVKRAIAHFAMYDINMLIPAVHIRDHKSILGLIQHYGSLRSAVSAQLGLWEKRRSYIARSHPHPAPAPAYYGDDIVITEQPSRTYWRYLCDKLYPWPVRAQEASTSVVRRWRSISRHSLSFIRSCVYVSEPAVVAYFAYLALYAYAPQPLALAWMLGAGSWFFYVTADRYTTMRQKIRLLLLTPGMQVLLYALSLNWLVKILSNFPNLKLPLYQPKTAVSKSP